MNEFSRRYGLKMSAMLGALAATGNLAWFGDAAAAPVPVGTPDLEGQGTVGGEFIAGIVELPDTLDPHKTGAAVTSTILRNCGDSLIAKDYDGNYVPWIASAWTISDDGLVWTFTIRDGVTFQDGTPLNAEAVKWSFDRVLDPATAAVTAGGLIPKGAITALVDEKTFQITLAEPFAPFLDNLTASTLSIVSPTAVQEMGDEFGQKPVLSGPWMVDEWRTGDRIILKRNPNYAWPPEYLHQDPPGAFIETITFQSIIEEASRVAAFEAGEIHQVTIPAVDVERLADSEDFWVVSYRRKGVVFIEFNVTQPPFDDVNVRKALNHAVNKQDVFEAAIEGLGELAYGFLSPTIPGYWEGMPEYAPAYDPEAAKTLLAEAGWADSDGDGVLEKDGKKFEFVLLNLPTDSWNRGAQVVQSQLAEIGVSMEIQQMEFATLLDEAKTASHQAEMMGYTYSDPDIAYLWFHSSQAGTGLNMSHIKDPALDKMIMRGRAVVDPTERAEVYAEIQRYISDLALWIPLWIDQYYVAFNKRLQNGYWHPDNYAVYYDAWIND
jgi:peptide/nickel transport system substrate-binding protein